MRRFLLAVEIPIKQSSPCNKVFIQCFNSTIHLWNNWGQVITFFIFSTFFDTSFVGWQNKSCVFIRCFLPFLVIMGSSGKTVVGPLVPESGEEQIHRVQGFVLTPDTVKEGRIKTAKFTTFTLTCQSSNCLFVLCSRLTNILSF